MNYIVYALIGFPLLGAIFAITRMLPAKRLTDSNITLKSDADENVIKARFYIVCAAVLSNVIYGVLEFVLIWQRYGMTPPENLKYPCIVGFLCTTAACILMGIIGEREIEKGMLNSVEVFSKGLIKLCIAEVIAVLGLMYFFVSMTGLL